MIEHVAIWTDDLERLRAFYERYFGGRRGRAIRERVDGIPFLLSRRGRRRPARADADAGRRRAARRRQQRLGSAHIAFALGSEQAVDELTDLLRSDGYEILDGPRRTGDGYYESVVCDPDGNRVELTV